jgi:hypothetical protein
MKKRPKNTDADESEEGDNSTTKEEEEKNDYTVKKTTKGSEFYDDFMNQVAFV